MLFNTTLVSGDRICGLTMAQVLALPAADLAAALPGVLRAHAADKRWRLQSGGTTLGGTALRTDDASCARLAQAAQLAAANPAWTTDWKFGDGTWGTVTAAQATAMFATVAGFVSACFAREKAANLAIASGAATTAAAVDVFFA